MLIHNTQTHDDNKCCITGLSDSLFDPLVAVQILLVLRDLE